MVVIQKIINNELITLSFDNGKEIEYSPRDKWWDKFTHSYEYFPNAINVASKEEESIILSDLTYWLKDITIHYFSCGCGYDENHKIIFENYLNSYNLLKYLSLFVFAPNSEQTFAFNTRWNCEIIKGMNDTYLPEKLLTHVKHNPNDWVKKFISIHFKNIR